MSAFNSLSLEGLQSTEMSPQLSQQGNKACLASSPPLAPRAAGPPAQGTGGRLTRTSLGDPSLSAQLAYCFIQHQVGWAASLRVTSHNGLFVTPQGDEVTAFNPEKPCADLSSKSSENGNDPHYHSELNVHPPREVTRPHGGRHRGRHRTLQKPYAAVTESEPTTETPEAGTAGTWGSPQETGHQRFLGSQPGPHQEQNQHV